MTRMMLSILWGMILGLCLLTQSGCLLLAAAAGTGAGVAYVQGDLDTTFDADPKAVADATEHAFKAMDVAVISKSSSSVDAKIVGRTARDTKLEVCVSAESDHLSRTSIRAGTFGDSSMQERLCEEIRKQLKSTAAAASTQPATQPAVADVK